MALDNISTEFAYEFFSQIKRFSEEGGIEKEKAENKEDEEVRLIRPILAVKKQKFKVIEKESAIEKIKRLMED